MQTLIATDVHPLWLRVWVATAGILSLLCLGAAATLVFALPQPALRAAIPILPLLIAIVSGYFFWDCRFLLYRYDLYEDRLAVYNPLLRRERAIRVSEIRKVERFTIESLKPRDGSTAASSGWRIVSQTGEEIVVTEALTIYPEIAQRFDSILRTTW